MSRVQTREDIIIMQPFRKEPFQRGVSIENQIMMAHFRKQFRYRDELLDLHVLRITIQSVCTVCDKGKINKRDFTLYEDYCDEHRISPTRDTLTCNKCFKEDKKKCRRCEKHLTLDKYNSLEEFQKIHAVCIECKEAISKSKAKHKRMCSDCTRREEIQIRKTEDEFHPDEWKKQRNRCCRICMTMREDGGDPGSTSLDCDTSPPPSKKAKR